MSTTTLRVKIKSLGAEARIIRLEERRLTGTHMRLPVPKTLTLPQPTGRKVRDPRSGQLPWLREHQGDPALVADLEDQRAMLHKHRTHDVRVEARAALLAYGLLRGKPYSKIEPPNSTIPNAIKVVGLVARFGGMPANVASANYAAWITAERKVKDGLLIAA
jgi:hypothetical protein